MTFGLFICIAVAIVLADQGTKFLALQKLSPIAPVPVIPGFFQLTLTTNTGAAFSILQSAAGLLAFVALAAILGISYYFFKQRHNLSRIMATAMALAVGGATGNFIDRVTRHFVVDFFDVYVGKYHWPIFNVADSSICIGVGLIALTYLSSANSKVHGQTEPAAEHSTAATK